MVMSESGSSDLIWLQCAHAILKEVLAVKQEALFSFFRLFFLTVFTAGSEELESCGKHCSLQAFIYPQARSNASSCNVSFSRAL